MTFVVARHRCEQGIIMVISDQDIVGRKFLEGKKQLDLSVPFYQGTKEPQPEVEELLQCSSCILHLTGKEIIALALKLGVVQKDQVLVVQGIPHVEVVEG